MHRRPTSKKRAVDAEQEINMDEKEAMPVEDIKAILPPMEPTKPTRRAGQPEQPTKQGDANFLEMMKFMKEQFTQIDKKMDDTNKKIDDSNKELKEELKADNQKNNESLKEELS